MNSIGAFLTALRATLYYWLALINWVFYNKGYSEVTYFEDDLHAHVQVYSLSLIFSLVSIRPQSVFMVICLHFHLLCR